MSAKETIMYQLNMIDIRNVSLTVKLYSSCPPSRCIGGDGHCIEHWLLYAVEQFNSGKDIGK